MKQTIIKAGVSSGVLMAVFMLLTVPFLDKIGYSNAEIIGYTGMMIAFLPVFFGLKTYRDKVCEGYIAFSRVVSISMLCSVIACLFYVATWLVIYYGMPGVIAKMDAQSLIQMKAVCKTPQELDTAMKQMQQMKQWLSNPLTNAALTFTEPLPVVLIFSLITGVVLKKKPTQNITLS
jgi:hypothetical protein